MKIGIIVEGQSEFGALPQLAKAVNSFHEIGPAAMCKVDPLASVQQIARRVAGRCRILFGKAADRVIVVLDHEGRWQCVPQFASALEQEISNRLELRSNQSIVVVMKVNTFENWLIADPQALRGCPALFTLPKTFANRVAPNKADGINALNLLKRWTGPGRSYDKVHGAASIAQKMDPHRAALNSRSFRRLLRVLRDPLYEDQSKVAR